MTSSPTEVRGFLFVFSYKKYFFYMNYKPMKYYKVDDRTMRNCVINECEFNNLYLTSLYDVDKYRMYYNTSDFLRRVLLENLLEEEEFGRFELYVGEYYFGECIPGDVKTYYIIRLRDSKIFPLYKVDRGDEPIIVSDSRMLVERYVSKKNVYYVPNDRDLFSYSKFNALSYLYSICR
jgi:hypothetical protein